MRILVTGNLGFIGRNLTTALRSLGYEVVGMDREVFCMGSWKETFEVTMDAHDPEFVFHVGANSNTMESDINLMMTENFDFTEGLALWCLEKKVPLVYSSSASVYGNEGGEMNLYAWSKYAGEAIVLMMGGVALRYFNVYGRLEEGKGKMASIMYQGWKQMNRGEKTILFPLKPKRDFVYIDDVVSANIHALENYKVLSGRFFDVGVGVARTFEEVMELMGIPYRVSDDLTLMPKNYQYYTRANPDNFMEGWKPKYRLEDGVREYLKYLNGKG